MRGVTEKKGITNERKKKEGVEKRQRTAPPDNPRGRALKITQGQRKGGQHVFFDGRKGG